MDNLDRCVYSAMGWTNKWINKTDEPSLSNIKSTFIHHLKEELKSTYKWGQIYDIKGRNLNISQIENKYKLSFSNYYNSTILHQINQILNAEYNLEIFEKEKKDCNSFPTFDNIKNFKF